MGAHIDEQVMRDIVAQIMAGDPRGAESLYKITERGIRYYAASKVSPSAIEDVLHNTILVVIEQVRNGSLRQPEALMSYTLQITRAQIGRQIGRERDMHATDTQRNFQPIDNSNPERDLLIKERAQMLRDCIAQMNPLDREILTRFYLQEQTEIEIRDAMGLSEGSYRNHKSRAKAKLTAIVQERAAA